MKAGRNCAGFADGSATFAVPFQSPEILWVTKMAFAQRIALTVRWNDATYIAGKRRSDEFLHCIRDGNYFLVG
jgi:hypothetical protein